MFLYFSVIMLFLDFYSYATINRIYVCVQICINTIKYGDFAIKLKFFNVLLQFLIFQQYNTVLLEHSKNFLTLFSTILYSPWKEAPFPLVWSCFHRFLFHSEYIGETPKSKLLTFSTENSQVTTPNEKELEDND